MLIYTNNLELTHYHTKKGFYYYIEFIEQSISKKNINLNLTSQDAVMFVYKKTINNFTINHISCKLHNKIKIFLNIYNYLLINHLNYNDFILDKDKLRTKYKILWLPSELFKFTNKNKSVHL